MGKSYPLDTAVEAVSHYRSQLSSDTRGLSAPPLFENIQEMFRVARDNKVEVIIECSEINNMGSVRLKLDYIGERWCRGYEEKRHFGELIRIPHTVSYAEILVSGNEADRTKAKTKVFFKGDNPFV